MILQTQQGSTDMWILRYRGGGAQPRPHHSPASTRNSFVAELTNNSYNYAEFSMGQARADSPQMEFSPNNPNSPKNHNAILLVFRETKAQKRLSDLTQVTDSN